MAPHELRLIAVVNLLTDLLLPNPDGPEPEGPWAPWLRESLSMGPFPQPWKEGPLPEPWKEGPLPDPWARAAVTAALGQLGGLTGQVDDHNDPFHGRRPRPNWFVGALMRDLTYLNPQPPPPIDSGIAFARNLAIVAMRHATEAGDEKGGSMLKHFSDDWCGTMWRPPIPKKPGDPGEPRPPRPQESLVLGAALFRATRAMEDGALRVAGEDAARKIFEQGLSSLG